MLQGSKLLLEVGELSFSHWASLFILYAEVDLTGVSYSIETSKLHLDIAGVLHHECIRLHQLVRRLNLDQQEVAVEVLLQESSKQVSVLADDEEEHLVSLWTVLNTTVKVLTLE